MKIKTLTILTLIIATISGYGADTNSIAQISNASSITSDRTYYDRREGVVIFTGNVHINDSEYQMHSDKAYVFMSITNDINRIVAIGSIALTNEAKRAYGTKATYRRDTGLVVLYGDDKRLAEVRETSNDGDRVVTGRKIRFWINREQVEVIDATITAPSSGNIDGFKLIQ